MQHSLISNNFAGSSCAALCQRKSLSLRLQRPLRQCIRAHSTYTEPGQAARSSFAGKSALSNCTLPFPSRADMSLVIAELCPAPAQVISICTDVGQLRSDPNEYVCLFAISSLCCATAYHSAFLHLQTTVRVGPDANQAGSTRPPGAPTLPNVWWRAFSAIFYIIPAWDCLQYGKHLWRFYPQSAFIMLFIGKYKPAAKLCWSCAVQAACMLVSELPRLILGCRGGYGNLRHQPICALNHFFPYLLDNCQKHQSAPLCPISCNAGMCTASPGSVLASPCHVACSADCFTCT